MVSRKFEQLMKDANVLVRNLQKQGTETSFLTVRTDNFIEDSHVVKKFSRLGFDVYEPSLKKHRAEANYFDCVVVDSYDVSASFPAVVNNPAAIAANEKRSKKSELVRENVGAFLSLTVTIIATVIAVMVLGLPLGVLAGFLSAILVATTTHQIMWGAHQKANMQAAIQAGDVPAQLSITSDTKVDASFFKTSALVVLERSCWGLMRSLFKTDNGDFLIGLVKQKIELNDGNSDLLEWLTAVHITLESSPDFPLDAIPLITEAAVTIADKAVARAEQDARRSGELDRTYSSTLKKMAVEDSVKAVERANDFLERF